MRGLAERIRTQMALVGAWYAYWYSYFCAARNSRNFKWLLFFFDSGQGRITALEVRDNSSKLVGVKCDRNRTVGAA
jgi:hypothetical protein